MILKEYEVDLLKLSNEALSITKQTILLEVLVDLRAYYPSFKEVLAFEAKEDKLGTVVE